MESQIGGCVMDEQKMKQWMKVYFIMGSLNCTEKPEVVLEEALRGGITLFQYREKGEGCLLGDEKVELARRLQQLCKTYQVPFIINDDIEMMEKLDADGLHVGQEDGNLQEIRNRIPGKIFGVSVHNDEEAKRALALGADYLGVGPTFPTATKTDTRNINGIDVLKDLRGRGITAPIVGIGGINENNASKVIQAGADGVAVITAISSQSNPQEATKMLVQKTEAATKL